ncbi:S-layer homology domain-containing protein [Kocuria marina]
MLPQAVRFTDTARNPFRTEIQWLADKSITTGYPDGTFRPAQPINRDAMAAFLYRMAGKPAFTAPKTSRFKDVRPGQAFYKEIHWLAAKGITTGYSDGTFRPGQPINRGSMAAFLYRYAGQPAFTAPKTSRFKDVRPGQAFYKEIHWLAARNITTGYQDRTFRPAQPIARDAMAAFLYRYTHPRWNAPKPNAGKATYLANLEATDNDGFYPEAGQIRGSTYARSITGEYYGN